MLNPIPSCGYFIFYNWINIGQRLVTIPNGEFIFNWEKTGNRSFLFNPNEHTLSCYQLLLWDFGDGTMSTETNPVHTYKKPGVYHVKLSYTVFESVGDWWNFEWKNYLLDTRTIKIPDITPIIQLLLD